MESGADNSKSDGKGTKPSASLEHDRKRRFYMGGKRSGFQSHCKFILKDLLAARQMALGRMDNGKEVAPDPELLLKISSRMMTVVASMHRRPKPKAIEKVRRDTAPPVVAEEQEDDTLSDE